MKLHSVFVIKASHDLYLLNKALLSILFAISILFREGLHSIIYIIFKLLSKIDCCKITLPNLLDRFELLMESSLIDFRSKNISPVLKLNFCRKYITACLFSTLKFNFNRFFREREL